MYSKKAVLLIICLAAAFALFLVRFKSQPPEEITQTQDHYTPLLNLSGEITGRAFRPEDLKGKVLFVNFWASWCPPCREEMPSIEAIYKEKTGNPNFKMITILYKDSYVEGAEYLKQGGYTFPVFTDTDETAAKHFGVTGVPETYIIDKQGVLKKRVIGPAEWNSPEAVKFINALLDE